MNQMVRNIISIRKKNKVSQAELGAEYGVAGSAISKIENGDRKIEFEFVEFVANYFNITLDELANYHDKEYIQQFTEIENISKEPKEAYLIEHERTAYLKRENESLNERVEELKFTIGVMANGLADYRKITDLKNKKP